MATQQDTKQSLIDLHCEMSEMRYKIYGEATKSNFSETAMDNIRFSMIDGVSRDPSCEICNELASLTRKMTELADKITSIR
jgi:hypothetical protein